MKKLLTLLALIILISGSSSTARAGIVRFGAISGDYEEDSISNETKQAYFIGLEAVNPSDFAMIEMGLGIELQQPASLSNTAGEFYLVPVYISMNICNPKKTTGPYFTTRLGYCFFEADHEFENGNKLKGGVYYGLGAGLRFNGNFKIEMLYSLSNATRETALQSLEIEYWRKSLAFGYNF